MCGITGIYSHKTVAHELYESVINLQHRGTDAAGMMTYDNRMHKEKGLGLARDIFTKNNLSLLTGNIGISHNRYPTHGGFGHGEIHPVWTSVPYGIGMAHNGQITNYDELVEEVTQKENRYLNTTSDTEVLLHIFAEELDKNGNPESSEEFFEVLCDAVSELYKKVRGAYSITSLIVGKGLVVFRDPRGIRPLVKGVRVNEMRWPAQGEIDYIFASENTMFYSLGYEP